MLRRTTSIAGLILVGLLGGSAARAEPLSFDDRVAARTAVERVRYAHRIGSGQSFEEAVPPSRIETRVRRSMRLSVALERFWGRPVTRAMLEHEIERIARDTRMPERLGEILAALGHDSLVVQECYARAVLVERLARDRYAQDRSIHAESRARIESLHRDLVSGEVDFRLEHPDRNVVELARSADGLAASTAIEVGLSLPPDVFDRQRSFAPERSGVIGPIREERDSYRILVVLAEATDTATIATFTVPKKNWDDWWTDVEVGLDGHAVPTVADPRYTLPAVATNCVLGEQWGPTSLGNQEPPSARARHTAVWTGNLMIVWGGSGPLNSGSRYDPVSDTWQATSTTGAPEARFGHTAIWADGKMIVWGGFDNAVLDSGGRYNPQNDTWQPTSAVDVAPARFEHTAVWTGSEMIVYGGRDAFNGAPIAAAWLYNIWSDSWMPASTPDAGLPRTLHSAVWTGSEMIVWGGRGSSAPLDSGSRYDPDSDTWTATDQTPGQVPTPRQSHGAVWDGSAMIVWGGRDDVDGGLSSGARYDPAMDQWTAIADAPGTIPGRQQHTTVWTGTRMIVWGGLDADADPLDSGGVYGPGDSWVETAPVGSPGARTDHTAVWSGTEMIVWGGRDPGALDSGGRYDPQAPMGMEWTDTARNVGAPPARQWHTAVWSGNEMIVWGGFDLGPLGSGSRYDPVADDWTDTPTDGAPSARMWHSAIWAPEFGSMGSMIVWGGSPLAATGAIYDSESYQWTATDEVGAPDPRYRHSAVWTGTEMIVWGGFGTTELDSGGRYNPEDEAWLPTNLTGAPDGRHAHTAVWTGSEMIVWGGGNPARNTGGRYDPAGNSWEATSTIDTPAPRFLHTAVWAVDEMIVWGGVSAIYYNSGGLYDPVDDSWFATTTTPDTPTPRFDHTAVWTGTDMFVWGGNDGAPTNSGSRFVPGPDPTLDPWFASSTVDAPANRGTHTAVWADDRMIVWGGFETNVLNSGGVTSTVDVDGDGHCFTNDCDDTDDTVWVEEVPGLVFTDRQTLTWDPPEGSGHAIVLYDTLRSGVASDFTNQIVCVAEDDPATEADDGDMPAGNEVQYYLVRAADACLGGLGSGSDGIPRTGGDCP